MDTPKTDPDVGISKENRAWVWIPTHVKVRPSVSTCNPSRVGWGQGSVRDPGALTPQRRVLDLLLDFGKLHHVRCPRSEEELALPGLEAVPVILGDWGAILQGD